MSKKINFTVTVLLFGCLILQILTLLGNFNKLRSVYIARFELSNPPSSSSGGNNNPFAFATDILQKATESLSDKLPDFFTVALFIACEGKSSSETVCTPATFGYKYNNTTTGFLQTVENNIPQWVHSALTGIQGGVFIPSAILCFILLCYSSFHLNTGKSDYGMRRKVTILLLAGFATLFCLITFVVQIVAYNMLKKGIDKIKEDLFGGMINNLVVITAKSGPSTWLSLAAFVSAFFATVLLSVSVCSGKSRKPR